VSTGVGSFTPVYRYYDPSTGQFLSVDPLVDLTGQPYAYTGGDPVNATDPSGLDEEGEDGPDLFGLSELPGLERETNADYQAQIQRDLDSQDPLPDFRATEDQLQRKFNHAAEFGVEGNNCAETRAEFRTALEDFINDPSTIRTEGTYNREPAILNYNEDTRQTVVQHPNGEYWTNYQISEQQLRHVIEDGNLGGGH